jgi:hypothetical protein
MKIRQLLTFSFIIVSIMSYTTLVFPIEDFNFVRKSKESTFVSLKASDNKSFLIAVVENDPGYESGCNSDSDDGNVTESADESDYNSSDESEESRFIYQYRLQQNQENEEG